MVNPRIINLTHQLRQLLQVEDGITLTFHNIPKYIKNCISTEPYVTMFDIIGVMDMVIGNENSLLQLLQCDYIMSNIVIMSNLGFV